jgi:hypothetical protein
VSLRLIVFTAWCPAIGDPYRWSRTAQPQRTVLLLRLYTWWETNGLAKRDWNVLQNVERIIWNHTIFYKLSLAKRKLNQNQQIFVLTRLSSILGCKRMKICDQSNCSSPYARDITCLFFLNFICVILVLEQAYILLYHLLLVLCYIISVFEWLYSIINHIRSWTRSMVNSEFYPITYFFQKFQHAAEISH